MLKNESSTESLTSEFVELDNQFLIVNLVGKIIDHETSQKMVKDIVETVTPERNLLIMNLEQIVYINSNGLNSLISILTKTRTNGGELVLCGINDKVNQLLLITKLNSVFNIASNVEEAKSMLLNFKQN